MFKKYPLRPLGRWQKDRPRITPNYGDIPINDNRDISDLKNSLDKMNDDSEIVSLKDRFTKAYQQEIPFDPKYKEQEIPVNPDADQQENLVDPNGD